MAALHFMPLYPGDYHRDTQHLTTIEHGAYLLLLMAYWSKGGPLPDNDRKLAGIARLSMLEWGDIRSDMAEFFEIEDGLWKHVRVEKELEKARGKIEIARKAGEASARRRAEWKEKQAAEQAAAEATGVQRPLNEGPTNHNQIQNQIHHQTQIQEEEGSVDANASTGRPAVGLDLPLGNPACLPSRKGIVDPRDWFFHPSVLAFVRSGGATDKSARSLIGQLRKSMGDIKAARAIEDGFNEKPSDPVAWLKKASINNKSGVNRSTFDDVDYGVTGKIPD